MLVGRRVLLSWVLAGLLVTSVGCSQTAPTLEEIWGKYTTAFKGYHSKLHRYGKNKWPRWKAAFRQQKQHQFARIKLKTMKFQYLLEHDRDRLITDRGIHSFVNFAWTESDTRKFKQSVEGASDLLQKVREERRKFERFDWESIREAFRSLPTGNRYQEIQQNFQDRLDALSPWLKRYNQAREEP